MQVEHWEPDADGELTEKNLRRKEVRAARTGDAVEEFNQLQSKYARVAAALYLTC